MSSYTVDFVVTVVINESFGIEVGSHEDPKSELDDLDVIVDTVNNKAYQDVVDVAVVFHDDDGEEVDILMASVEDSDKAKAMAREAIREHQEKRSKKVKKSK